MTRDDARSGFDDAYSYALQLAGGDLASHPFRNVDLTNPRPGLRSWVVRTPPTTNDYVRSLQTWATIGETGTVTFAAAAGAHYENQDNRQPGSDVVVVALECAVVDFLGLLRAAGSMLGVADYDLQIGLEWAGDGPMRFVPGLGGDLTRIMIDLGETEPVHFVPVRSSVRADVDDQDFHRQAHDLALDCVHQGGIGHTVAISQPPAAR